MGELVNVDDIADTKAVAGMLGVSRQRVLQIMEESPNFPRPIKSFGRITLWDLDHVRAWMERPEVAERRSKHDPRKAKD